MSDNRTAIGSEIEQGVSRLQAEHVDEREWERALEAVGIGDRTVLVAHLDRCRRRQDAVGGILPNNVTCDKQH